MLLLEGISDTAVALCSGRSALAAKQRPSHPDDWMTSDAEIACPDPNCGRPLRITRLGPRRSSHADTTAVLLPPR